jgi:hypothetical protein
VLTADLDNDGWPDIYVADDSTASALYQNLKNGKFQDIAIAAGCALSMDGKPQAGMGISAGDYDLDGNLDRVKTNFLVTRLRSITISAAPPLKMPLSPPDSAATRNISAGALVFSISTVMAGPTSSSAMAMSIRRWSNCAPKRATRSASCSTKICTTAVSPSSSSQSEPPVAAALFVNRSENGRLYALRNNLRFVIPNGVRGVRNPSPISPRESRTRAL